MTKVYMATKNDLEQVKAAFNANDTTNVGYITWQMCLMRNYLKLNGMPLVNASVDYADLLQFAVDHELITTDVNDKALFKYDEIEDVLTLPDYVDLVLQGGTAVETIAAGLPNIEGGVNTVVIGASTDHASGALSTKIDETGVCTPGSYNYYKTFTLDASKANAIYGASSTVQPPAIKLIPQIKYRRGADGQVNGDGTPLGTVIMFMGTVAPQGYLFCDGTLYNVVDYPKFTAFIAKQFGSINYFGGDGETTFAVPDLRGEFLRCTGTNSHIDNGDGANVGEHQDGTIIAGNRIDKNTNTVFGYYATANTPVYKTYKNYDKQFNDSILGANQSAWIALRDGTGQTPEYLSFTSRPTNTSVMYCIKAKIGDEQ